MAVIGVTVTDTPTEVAGLVDGKAYILQNQGEVSVFVDTGSAAPLNSSSPGIEVPPRNKSPQGMALHVVEPTATDIVYLWTRGGEAEVRLAESI